MKVKEFSLPYYLSIASRRIIGFLPFPGVYEMQTASLRILAQSAGAVEYTDCISAEG